MKERRREERQEGSKQGRKKGGGRERKKVGEKSIYERNVINHHIQLLDLSVSQWKN